MAKIFIQNKPPHEITSKALTSITRNIIELFWKLTKKKLYEPKERKKNTKYIPKNIWRGKESNGLIMNIKLNLLWPLPLPSKAT